MDYAKELKECQDALFSPIGIVSQMVSQGYDMETIQNNVLVKEYMSRIEKAKKMLGK